MVELWASATFVLLGDTILLAFELGKVSLGWKIWFVILWFAALANINMFQTYCHCIVDVYGLGTVITVGLGQRSSPRDNHWPVLVAQTSYHPIPPYTAPIPTLYQPGCLYHPYTIPVPPLYHPIPPYTTLYHSHTILYRHDQFSWPRWRCPWHKPKRNGQCQRNLR